MRIRTANRRARRKDAGQRFLNTKEAQDWKVMSLNLAAFVRWIGMDMSVLRPAGLPLMSREQSLSRLFRPGQQHGRVTIIGARAQFIGARAQFIVVDEASSLWPKEDAQETKD